MTVRRSDPTGTQENCCAARPCWAGTFHAVGARILREYAQRIGLKPSFTILDRSDAADLMDVVRHDLGLSKKETRFPGKDTCLAIYSFAINSGASIKETLASK